MGIITIAAVAFYNFLNKFSEANENWVQSVDANIDLFEINAETQNNYKFNKLSDLITTQTALDAKKYRKYWLLTAASAMALTGGAVIVAGSLLSFPISIAAGAIITIASAVFALGSIAWYQPKIAVSEKDIRNLAPMAKNELKDFRINQKTVSEKPITHTYNISSPFATPIPIGKPISAEELADYLRPSAPPIED